MTSTTRFHCAWAACSRLYVKTWGGQSYCGHRDCPASRIAPEYGPRERDAAADAAAAISAFYNRSR